MVPSTPAPARTVGETANRWQEAHKRGRLMPLQGGSTQGELRYFGGLSEAEVAAAISLSPPTVRREVASARFWLGRRMRGEP